MQVVIEMSEEYYNVIKAIPDRQCDADMLIIKRGIPLPKGHGDLKDVDHYIKMQWEHPDYSLTDDEPTIIEADTGEREDKE